MSTSQIALLASVQQFLDRQHGLYIDGAPCAAQSENFYAHHKGQQY